jgi:hypothetical protein
VSSSASSCSFGEAHFCVLGLARSVLTKAPINFFHLETLKGATTRKPTSEKLDLHTTSQRSVRSRNMAFPRRRPDATTCRDRETLRIRIRCTGDDGPMRVGRRTNYHTETKGLSVPRAGNTKYPQASVQIMPLPYSLPADWMGMYGPGMHSMRKLVAG